MYAIDLHIGDGYYYFVIPFNSFIICYSFMPPATCMAMRVERLGPAEETLAFMTALRWCFTVWKVET